MGLALTLRGLTLMFALTLAAGMPAKPYALMKHLVFGQILAPEESICVRSQCLLHSRAFLQADLKAKFVSSHHIDLQHFFVCLFTKSIICNTDIIHSFLTYPPSMNFLLWTSWIQFNNVPECWGWAGGTTVCQSLHCKAETNYSASPPLRGKTHPPRSSLEGVALKRGVAHIPCGN